MRWLLRQPRAWPLWGKWQKAYTSRLARIEGLRTIDRARLLGHISDADVAESIKALGAIMNHINVIGFSGEILSRAEQTPPVSVKTLDAIHLATAKLWQENNNANLAFITHDKQQAQAATALGLEVLG